MISKWIRWYQQRQRLKKFNKTRECYPPRYRMTIKPMFHWSLDINEIWFKDHNHLTIFSIDLDQKLIDYTRCKVELEP